MEVARHKWSHEAPKKLEVGAGRPVPTSALLSTSDAALLRARAAGSKIRDTPAQIPAAEVGIKCVSRRVYVYKFHL